MDLIDVSRSISPSTAVWPGDQEVEWNWTARLEEEGASVNLGALTLSTHTGTHVDAPLHVLENGKTCDELPLSAFVGCADLIEIGDADAVRPEHVADISSPRVLVKTGASQLPDDEWPSRVPALKPATVDTLAENGVVLFGTDAPSIDPLDSTDLPGHRALMAAGIVNVEGLCFRGVETGTYYLMALPLKLQGGDAAPVRAVLSEAPPARSD